MNRVNFGLATVVLSGILLLGAYTVKLWFSDLVFSEPGTYAFIITITDPVISDFPILQPVGAPSFSYSSADGPKPAIQTVTYISASPMAELVQTLVAVGRKYGFTSMNEELDCTSGSLWTRNEEVLEVCIEEVDNSSRRVTVQLASLVGRVGSR